MLRSIILQGNGVHNNYIPNKLNNLYKSASFELEFIVDKNVYNYFISYDEKQIEKETLIKNKKSLFSVKHRDVTTELLSNNEIERVKQTFSDSCLDQRIFKKPLISMIKRWLSGISPDISKVFDYLGSIICLKYNEISIPLVINFLSNSQRPPEKAFEKIIEHLQKMDINVSNADASFLRHCVKTEEYSDGRKVLDWLDEITFYHKGISGNKIPLKLSEESRGTQLLLGLLGVVLLCLENGRALFVDELNNSLHPFILQAIVRMFKDKNLNTNNAQLIFSTHDTSILEDELLRISEASFVTNSVSEGMRIRRLCDFEGITNADNFRKLYINGQLGSIPFTV